MMGNDFNFPSDRLVRGGAWAALVFLAAALLSLGFYLYRPTLAAAEPDHSGVNASLNPADDASAARSNQ